MSIIRKSESATNVEPKNYGELKTFVKNLTPGEKIKNFNTNSATMVYHRSSKNLAKKFIKNYLTAEGWKSMIEEREGIRAKIHTILLCEFGEGNYQTNIKSPLILQFQRAYTKESLEKLMGKMEQYAENRNNEDTKKVLAAIQELDL